MLATLFWRNPVQILAIKLNDPNPFGKNVLLDCVCVCGGAFTVLSIATERPRTPCTSHFCLPARVISPSAMWVLRPELGFTGLVASTFAS